MESFSGISQTEFWGPPIYYAIHKWSGDFSWKMVSGSP